MSSEYKCPKCGSDTILSGSVSCWCDKDFCTGQRCGADKLYANYECTNDNCKDKGTPPVTDAYYRRHLD